VRYIDQRGASFSVEHKLFKMDSSVQKQGFGKKFIAQSEAYYINAGFKKITLMTGWQGARHWARAGYDWRQTQSAMTKSFGHLVRYALLRGFTDNSTPAGKRFNELMMKVTPDYGVTGGAGGWKSGEFKPKSIAFHPVKGDFPIPNDFATIGYSKGLQDWGGKELLSQLNLYYEKVLTPKGTQLKTNERK
jgi:hypothetical protein